MTKYSINKIFEDSAINTILDRMHYDIETVGKFVNIDERFLLTGRAAALLQDGTPGACDNIIFITDHQGLFAFIASDMARLLSNQGVVKLKDRIIFYCPGFVLEVWKISGPLAVNLVQDIFVEHSSKINPILL